MTGFPILDLVAGMIFIFFLLSVISSSIVEVFMTLSKARSKILAQWLTGIFDKQVPGANKTLGQAIMDHCSVTAISGDGKSNSYIDAKNFVSAFIEKVTYDPADPKSVATDFSSLIDKIRDSDLVPQELKRVLLGYATEVRDAYEATQTKTTGQIEMFRTKFENWFDSSMDRITGTLKKKYLQPFTFTVGVFITLFMNADSIAISRYLYTNKDAQGKLAALAYSAPTNEEFQKKVAQMDKVKKDDPKDTATMSKMESDIKTSIETIKTTQAEIPSGLPLGWDNDHFGRDNWLTKTAGWLLTIFAIFMGAPFWFDLLNKISNLRGSGPKPKSSTDKKSKK
jgi:hypothetical protein